MMKVLDQKNTPVWNRLRNGKKPENELFGWSAEKMGKRRRLGVPRGQDIKGFEKDSAKKLYNRTTRAQRTPHVTQEAQELNKTNGVSNEKEYNKQVRKKTIETKRDIEFRLLGDGCSEEDDGINGNQMYGIGRVVNDGSTGEATSTAFEADGTTPTLDFEDQQTAIPKGYRTPTDQIYAGTLADFDQAALNAIMAAKKRRTGVSSELTLFAAVTLKTHLSDFGNYVPNKEGSTVVVRTERASVDKRRLVTSGIDVFEGEHGVITVEEALYMPTDKRGYLLDFDHLEKRVLYLARHWELENKGGGRRGIIDSILSWAYGDPRAHGKIAPSDEVEADPDLDA